MNVGAMPLSYVCRSAVFAFLLPLSVDAKDALKLRANMSLLESSELQKETISLPPGDQLVAKLDYALLFGRRCLSFGSSRADQVYFPSTSDIDKHHFILHFDISTAALLLTDTSTQGVWVSDGATQALKHLHHTTLPLSQTTDIYFGRNNRYQFRIVVAEYAPDVTASSRLFEDYIQSIGFISRTSSSSLSMTASSDKGCEIVLKESIDQDSEAPIVESYVKEVVFIQEPSSLWRIWAVWAVAAVGGWFWRYSIRG
jgi:hypothetical protein